MRIKSFLGDGLALAGEDPDSVREGVRVALAKSEAIFRLQEPNKRMREPRDERRAPELTWVNATEGGPYSGSKIG